MDIKSLMDIIDVTLQGIIFEKKVDFIPENCDVPCCIRPAVGVCEINYNDFENRCNRHTRKVVYKQMSKDVYQS